MTNSTYLRDFLLNEGYSNLKEIPGKGVCGIKRFIFTIAIVVNLDEIGYEGRYCFHNFWEAIESLTNWDGTGDPSGNWIKYKGDKKEYRNLNYQEND